MGSALWAGISGLNASSKELDVIANNLANVNTIGFKSDSTYFADVLSQSISGGSSGSMQVGRGVTVAEVSTNFGSGSFETTGVATDCAIDGDGFFMVSDDNGATYYTRAGAFSLDSSGNLVDPNGYTVQGKEIVNGEATGALGDINLSDVQSTPEVTTSFSIGVNLSSETEVGGQYSTTQTVYDSLGATHSLNTTFTKTAYSGTGDSSSYWGVESSMDDVAADNITADGFIFSSTGVCTGTYTGTASSATGTGTADVTAVRPGMIYQDGSITLTSTAATPTATSWTVSSTEYPNASIVQDSTSSATHINISLDGEGTTDISFDLTGTWSAIGQAATTTLDNTTTTSLADVTVNYSSSLAGGATIGTGGDVNWDLQGDSALTLTQYSTSSVIRSLTADGYSSGSLQSLSIASDGTISGFFTNGQTADLARLMLASFSNPDGLQKMGSNLYAETVESGAAIQNYAGEAGMGSLASNSLEMSNTDIATEFIKMITAQKAYQASAKVVTTENDMMQVLMNIKQ